MPTPAVTPSENQAQLATITQLRAAIETLEALAGNHGLLALLPEAERRRLRQAAASVYNPDARARRRMVKAVVRERKSAAARRDDQVRAETGIRDLRRQPVFTTPNVFRSAGTTEPRKTLTPQHCYICKEDYSVVHHFYDRLCPACGDLNFAKRTELADLRGRVALLTGGRVKIGYQAGLKLLRAGAHLVVTTRFPRDSAVRYAAEPDFDAWRDRLEIFGLDLRHTPSVEAFCAHLVATRSRLDFIVNNACQTVRRPPEFYAHMMARETAALGPAPGARPRGAGRRYHRAHGGPADALAQVPGVTLGAAAVAGAAAAEELRTTGGPVPGGTARSGSAAGRPARAQLVAPAAGRGVVDRAARSAAGQRRRALHHQRAPQAADAPHAGTRQAHRQRLGRRGPVLPELEDHAPSAHQHGQGRVEHDDAHVGHRLPLRRHPHEQRRHRLGHRRGRGRDCRAEGRRARAFIRRSTSSTARRASWTPSSAASTPARTCGDSS